MLMKMRKLLNYIKLGAWSLAKSASEFAGAHWSALLLLTEKSQFGIKQKRQVDKQHPSVKITVYFAEQHWFIVIEWMTRKSL